MLGASYNLCASVWARSNPCCEVRKEVLSLSEPCSPPTTCRSPGGGPAGAGWAGALQEHSWERLRGTFHTWLVLCLLDRETDRQTLPECPVAAVGGQLPPGWAWCAIHHFIAENLSYCRQQALRLPSRRAGSFTEPRHTEIELFPIPQHCSSSTD